MPRLIKWLLLLQALLAAAVIVLAVVVYGNRHQIAKNHHEIDCLKHPHRASSIAGRFVGKGKHRHFVITQPAHRTGC